MPRSDSDHNNPNRHFKTLGLSKFQRTQRDVKDAYHKLALENHPDKAGPKGEETMKQINEAYETIMELRLYVLVNEQEPESVVFSFWPGVYGPYQPNREGVFKPGVFKRRSIPKKIMKKPEEIIQAKGE